MATGFKNNKSITKGIRFPYELVEAIDASLEQGNPDDSNSSFSAWVLDACQRKLKEESSDKS